jgi:hydrogenase maturation protein HypF
VSQPVRLAVRIHGVVQGVGFRPFVHALATRLGLSGHVGNDAAGVFVEVEGSPSATVQFLSAVHIEAPPLAVVEHVDSSQIDPVGSTHFEILPSRSSASVNALVSADTTTCAACLAELWDPADRRHRYPFVNCTNCGPRFTIVRGVPYDRALTTMSAFPMCPACAREYADPSDRRFHAEPVCCPACGPRLTLHSEGGPDTARAMESAVDRLRTGEVLAVKGLGGYHLAVDATNEEAARTLRARKHREDKPFAVMVPDLATARRLCEVDGVAEHLLADQRRPIVLLPKLSTSPVAYSVAPGNRRLGLMLPYTPLHHLLLADLGIPIVLTSGNLSDEPIVYRDDEARERLGRITDAFLTHDRPIHIRTDDSVVRPFRGREQLQRRSRGYVPGPVTMRDEFPLSVLACGAELKNTFCLGRGRHAFPSHHIGDLENYETMQSFTRGVQHFQQLLGIRPEAVAHDLHPEYLSTKYAHDLADDQDLHLVGVQHHHAHIASCLADNLESGPVIGVAFDGLGFGTDGTIWGGEFLLADLGGFRRVAHLAPVPMPGGATAIKQPWRMAVAYLEAAGCSDVADDLAVAQRHGPRWSEVVALTRSGLGSPTTSSAGRLFDAVAALLDVRDTVNYEGQAAIELEQCADPRETGTYDVAISDGDPLVVQAADLVRDCLHDRRSGIARETVAARFHNAVVDVVVRTCLTLQRSTGVGTVALSGGVFQNLLLLERVVRALEEHGLRVLTHSRVPTNDGGVSLGQAAVAGAQLRELGRRQTVV